MDIPEINGKATIPLWPDAGTLLGLSKNSTYAAAHRGDIPTLRFKSKFVVPVAPLLRMLGIEDERAVEQAKAAA